MELSRPATTIHSNLFYDEIYRFHYRMVKQKQDPMNQDQPFWAQKYGRNQLV